MFKLKTGMHAPGRLEKRLQQLPPYQLQGWADTCLNEVGQYLLQHTREGGREALDLAEESAVALLAVVREMQRR